LANVRWVIVDEVHALAESKRGTHLTLSLERLAALVRSNDPRGESEPVRIGLSATIHPLERVAEFLFGDRDGIVIDVSLAKAIDLTVASPLPDLVGATREEIQTSLYHLLDRLIEEHRTTLVFTNTRSGAERVVLHLKQRFPGKYAAPLEEGAALDGGTNESSSAPNATPSGPTSPTSGKTETEEGEGPRTLGVPPPPAREAARLDPRDRIAAHHGSMSRDVRLEVEERLKRGDLKCVVTSTSLELGIDIGFVDLVILLGSPRGVARALQRVGRSGHRLGETSKGLLVALNRDDLLECVVLAKMARERKLDALHIPENCLDVLAQHLLGLSLEGMWTVESALALARRAYPFRDLAKEDIEGCLAYLAGRYSDLERKNVYGKIFWDESSGAFRRRGRMALPIYYLNIGTIPETDRAKVFEGDRYVGEVEEDFLEELLPGDVFTLGGRSWAFQHARGMKAYVRAAGNQQPTVPQWFSEALPLSYEVAREVARTRRAIAERLTADGPVRARAWIGEEYRVSQDTAQALVRYVQLQARFAEVPKVDEVLVEEFVDDDLRRNYVFHVPVGRRANEALARTFAHALAETRGVPCRTVVNDYGFVLHVPRRLVLTVSDLKGLFFLDVRKELPRALPNTEILKRRFRHVATRGLLLLRNYPGRRQSVGRMQVNSFVLYHMLRKIDRNFPILKEVHREILEDAFDLAQAEDVCYRMLTRRIQLTVLRGRKTPSPFAFGLVVAQTADASLPDDRAALLRDLHERVHEVLDAENKGIAEGTPAAPRGNGARRVSIEEEKPAPATSVQAQDA
jgi:Lhr-like helicase